MRLFIAVDLDPAARSAIVREQVRTIEALGPGAAKLRAVRSMQLHLTLAFMPDVPSDVFVRLRAALEPPLVHAPFRLEFAGLGVFPPRGVPRVLWLGIVSGADRLVALQRLVAARVTSAGIALEDRLFTPHLTLGRWQGARPADRDRVARLETPSVTASVDVDEVILFESRLTAEGAVHDVVARTALR